MTRAAGHGRLAFAGWNLLLGLPYVLVSAFPPALQLVLLVVLSALLLPFVFRNIRSRLQNIGWDASGGKVLLWMLGSFVPILNLVLGLTLLFTPGRQSQAAAGGVGTSAIFFPSTGVRLSRLPPRCLQRQRCLRRPSKVLCVSFKRFTQQG